MEKLFYIRTKRLSGIQRTPIYYVESQRQGTTPRNVHHPSVFPNTQTNRCPNFKTMDEDAELTYILILVSNFL